MPCQSITLNLGKENKNYWQNKKSPKKVFTNINAYVIIKLSKLTIHTEIEIIINVRVEINNLLGGVVAHPTDLRKNKKKGKQNEKNYQKIISHTCCCGFFACRWNCRQLRPR